MLAVCLHQSPGHPVQKLPGEGGAVRPAPGAHHLLAAVQIPLEAAAQDSHIDLTAPRARHPSLPVENEITYVYIWWFANSNGYVPLCVCQVAVRK